MKRLLQKCISWMLAVLMLLEMLPFVSVVQAVEPAHGTLQGATLDCYPRLSYDEKADVYYIDLELNAEFYDHKLSENSSVPERGYFQANHTGDYLIELWGGKGADGAAGEGGRPGGTGGAGGYVYGKVHLDVGDILYYSLGGNGSLTYASGNGGGANNGGGGGRTITHGVGGGGGYSAVFLFADENDFTSRYLDNTGELTVGNINELDRSTKYIMIAGGGGGGGGAPGAGAVSATRKANGGAGGNIANSAFGTISDVGGAVDGRYYVGQDGESSGTSAAFIGRGGGKEPGAVASTSWSWYDGEKPNDWAGIHNTAAPGGAGGAGNLRGGAGGAGYCGGSGGVQQSLISPTQVGGGGGGSSFVAAEVSDLTDEEKTLLDETHTGTAGGAIAITYLANEDDSYAHLGDLSISFRFSPYFNLADFTITEGTKAGDDTIEEGQVIYDPATGKVDIHNISLLPSHHNLTGALTIHLGFHRKNAFAGGNGVPLLQDNQVTVYSTTQDCTINLPKDRSSVNVPLRFDVGASSHITNTPMHVFPDDMYTDRYDTVRPNLANDLLRDPMYDFIESISVHRVLGMDAAGVTVEKTTAFPVELTVTPKETTVNSVLGGKVGVTTFTQEALVTVLDLHQGKLNGKTVNFSKALTYEEGTGDYLFSVNTKSDSSEASQMPSPIVPPSGGSPKDDIEIPHDGWYLVQAWGANGAPGLSYIPQSSIFNIQTIGGDGGAGGYSWVYLYLKTTDKLKLESMGTYGVAPDTSKDLGGGGGTSTAISHNGQMLVIAGGGGGGGNAYLHNIFSFAGTSGEDGGDATTTIEGADYITLPDATKYDGEAGKNNGRIDGIFSWIHADGGAGGANYRSNNAGHYSTFEDACFTDPVKAKARYDEALSQAANPEVGYNGYFRVTCLEKDEDNHDVIASLSNYDLGVQFARYFEVKDITGQDAYSQDHTLKFDPVQFQRQDADTLTVVPHIYPVAQDATVNGQDFKRIDFTLTFRLHPRAEFRGGNDVPITHDNTVGYPTGAKLMQFGESTNISRYKQVETAQGNTIVHDPANFANVAVPPQTHATIDVKNQVLETYRVHLDTSDPEDSVARSELYVWAERWTKPTAEHEDYWKWEFLEPIETMIAEDSTVDAGAGPFRPEHNTHYTVTVGVGVKEPVYVPESFPVLAESQTLTKTAAILVQPKLTYDLNNLDTTHSKLHGDHDSMALGQSYALTLTPAEGYALPDSIVLTYDDPAMAETPIGFSYDNRTGEVVISASGVDGGDMTLVAAGVPKSYNITYHYEILGSTETGRHTESFLYGQPVTPWSWNGENVFGYTFAWTWYRAPGALDSGPPAIMPARDITVIGRYTPEEYYVAAEYYLDEDPETDTDPLIYHSGSDAVLVKFNESFSIPSPVIAGHATEERIFTGVMDEEMVSRAGGNTLNGKPLVVETIVYQPLEGHLRINYIREDTLETFSTYSRSCDAGTLYTIPSPQLEGYTPDQAEVVVQMTVDEVGEGKEINVWYEPNKYTVTYDFNGEGVSCTETEREVVFNKTYGDLSDGTFKFLPNQVIRDGYEFLGWYLGDQQITSNTKVTTARDHTLVAHWEAQEYVLLIRYEYADGRTAAPEIRETCSVGYKYSVDSVVIDGYTASMAKVEGTMPAQDVLYEVIYTGNPCTLTINYIYHDSHDTYATYVDTSLRYMDFYSVTSPELPGYSCSLPEVYGVMDNKTGKTINVYYYSEVPVIAVTIVWGAGDDVLTYDYDWGAWNPSTHEYDNPSITPTAANANQIYVSNDDSRVGLDPLPVDVSFGYSPSVRYPNISGRFTNSNSSNGTEVTTVADFAVGAVTRAWLWLTGKLPTSVSGLVPAGTCTVSITAGGDSP